VRLAGAAESQMHTAGATRDGPVRIPSRAACALLLLAGILVFSGRALAETGDGAVPPKDLGERSLPLRAALHHDPTMAAPFERLVSMYRGAGRMDELLTIYRTHLSQYPHDQGARAVLLRMMMATGDPETLTFAVAACERHPDSAYLHYLRYEALTRDHSPQALPALDRAIELEPLPGRRREWIDLLLPRALAQDRRDLAEKHLKAEALMAGESAEGLLHVARKMIRHGFHELALDVMSVERPAGGSPEVMVETELASASAEAGLGRMAEAASRLERLLSKLTADHWRRPEILRRRIALVDSDAEREAMVDSARERLAASLPGHPNHEAAVLDLARLLAGFERRRDALEVLLEGSEACPSSTRIEKEVLDLFDRLRDGLAREEYLAGRLAAAPDRLDLRALRTKSLYLIGRRGEAKAELKELLEKSPGEERLRSLLDVARFLRRSNLASDAGDVLTRAVELDPLRLDVRRELAEAYVAQGLRRRAAEVFKGELPEDVETEHLLDVVQFMIANELHREARVALRAAAAREESNLEIRTLLLTVEGKLANRDAGEELISGARSIADTVSRYRLWLESAVAFHDVFDAVGEFLDDERARLDLELGEWTKRALERRLVFADVAARNDARDLAAAMIDEHLAGDVPPEMKIALRRRLVAMLEKERGATDAVEAELRQLIEDDPSSADEYNARLALIYWAKNRHDLAVPALEALNVDALADPVILGRLRPLYQQRGAGAKAMRILERLTALDPTNRDNWQIWLVELAKAGDEPRLRGAILRLLAGVERMPIDEGSLGLLRSHLADSFWRSIAGKVASDFDTGRVPRWRGRLGGTDPERRRPELSEALVLLDSVGRIVREPDGFLWVAWTRAYVLNVLGRTGPRDEALAELERVAGLLSRPGDDDEADPATAKHLPETHEDPPPKPLPVILAFPDGLSVSLERARELLTRAVTRLRRAGRAGARRGPLPPFGVKWAFDTCGGSRVTRILPLGGSRVFVCDARGGVSCLDSETGKLLWTSAGEFPAAPPGALAPVPVHDGEKRILLPGRGEVACLSAETGRTLWRATVGRRPAGMAIRMNPGAAKPFVSVFTEGGEALAWDAASSSVSVFDLETGKVLREAALATDKGASATWADSGASFSRGRLLVHGACSAVLRADTTEEEWSFEPAKPRKLPVKLKEPGSGGAAGGASALSAMGAPFGTHPGRGGVVLHSGFGGYSRRYRGRRGGGPQYVYLNHFAQGPARVQQHWGGYGPPSGAVLAAPAVIWASCRGQPRLGVLDGGRLLLFRHSKLLVLDLDLPLKGREIDVSGTFVGTAGRVACMLQGGQLALADTRTGKVKTYGLAEVVAGRSNPRLDACVDGPHVYVTGPGGILCVNARAGLRVAFSTWPELVAPGKGTAPQSVYYHLQGTGVAANNAQGPCIPPTCLVDRSERWPGDPEPERVLYATPEPWRVVALVPGPDDAAAPDVEGATDDR